MNQQPRIPKNKIILIAISTKWLDINPKLTHFIEQTGCNIDECSMSLKGNMAMMSMCLSGSWDSLAKLDARLPGFIQHEDIQILTERIATLDLEDDCAPYFMQAVARDKPGLLTQFNQFFSRRIHFHYRIGSKFISTAIRPSTDDQHKHAHPCSSRNEHRLPQRALFRLLR